MEWPKNVFAFAPQFNKPDHKHPERMSNDALGAFQPGMHDFAAIHRAHGAKAETYIFNNNLSNKMTGDAIMHALWKGPNQLDAIAYFGHGTDHSMSSAHIGENRLHDFAKVIRGNSRMGVKILLYACSTGNYKWPGGCFSAKLADELRDLKATVYGHSIEGHTYRNNMLYKFPGGTPVAPKGYESNFSYLTHETDFWARFAFMTEAEIAAEAKAAPAYHPKKHKHAA